MIVLIDCSLWNATRTEPTDDGCHRLLDSVYSRLSEGSKTTLQAGTKLRLRPEGNTMFCVGVEVSP